MQKQENQPQAQLQQQANGSNDYEPIGRKADDPDIAEVWIDQDACESAIKKKGFGAKVEVRVMVKNKDTNGSKKTYYCDNYKAPVRCLKKVRRVNKSNEYGGNMQKIYRV